MSSSLNFPNKGGKEFCRELSEYGASDEDSLRRPSAVGREEMLCRPRHSDAARRQKYAHVTDDFYMMTFM
jgi:hypothetical protein